MFSFLFYNPNSLLHIFFVPSFYMKDKYLFYMTCQIQYLMLQIYLYIYIYIVGSQIVAHTQMKTGDGPNKPNTMNL